jgi:hypothetical protein
MQVVVVVLVLQMVLVVLEVVDRVDRLQIQMELTQLVVVEDHLVMVVQVS